MSYLHYSIFSANVFACKRDIPYEVIPVCGVQSYQTPFKDTWNNQTLLDTVMAIDCRNITLSIAGKETSQFTLHCSLLPIFKLGTSHEKCSILEQQFMNCG